MSDVNPRFSAVPSPEDLRNFKEDRSSRHRISLSLQRGNLFSVAQICNLPPACRSLGAGRYRRIAFGSALECFEAQPISNRRYSAARRSRNQSQLGRDAFHRVHIECVGSVALDAVERVPTSRTRPEFARLATILGDTDRVQLCATMEGPLYTYDKARSEILVADDEFDFI